VVAGFWFKTNTFSFKLKLLFARELSTLYILSFGVKCAINKCFFYFLHQSRHLTVDLTWYVEVNYLFFVVGKFISKTFFKEVLYVCAIILFLLLIIRFYLMILF